MNLCNRTLNESVIGYDPTTLPTLPSIYSPKKLSRQYKEKFKLSNEEIQFVSNETMYLNIIFPNKDTRSRPARCLHINKIENVEKTVETLPNNC